MNDAILVNAKKTGRLGVHPFFWYDSISSTNVRAMEMVKDGADSGTIVMAETQNSGRGRLGRAWVSPKGTGLYVSIILRPQVDLEHLSKITLAAGVAVSKAIDSEAGVSSKIKWPNDVLIKGKKIAGILSESTGAGLGGTTAVILGIGINVNTPQANFPQELQNKATSLMAVTGNLQQRGALLERLVREVELANGALEKGRFSKILEDFKERDATMGKRLNWVNAANEVVLGTSMGLDQNGHLQIKDSSGKLHEVISGDINISESN